jgi:hypothetical protein
MFISGEFEVMRSFLEAANDDRAKNKVMMTWVRQIRELASDLEDGIELAVHLDMESTWWLRMIPSCIAPTLPLDEAEAEIKELRDRVEELSGRNKRYNIIPDAGSNTTTFLVPLLQPAPDPVSSKRQVGVQDLSRLISNKRRDLQVISVLCTGGDFGMATLIREAYNDPEICRQFSCRAWIKLVRPFNPDDFLKSLLTQFYATSSHHQANLEPFFRRTEEYHLIKAELMQQVRNQRYLIILEDLISVAEWDVMRMYLPDNNNGSRIVVATRQLALALSCTGEPYQVSNLRQLSDGQSLCAFFSRVSMLARTQVVTFLYSPLFHGLFINR